MMAMGCENHREANKETERLGCRPQDRIDKSLIAEEVPAPTFHLGKNSYMTRAPRTTANKVTAWWDASQVYGYDETYRRPVKRD
jgi:Animal haem peroxidase